MRVGILGASGNIGFNVSRWLDKHTRYEIVPIVKNSLSYSMVSPYFKQTLNMKTFSELEKFDIIINSARIRKNPYENIKLNKILTKNILKYFKGEYFFQFSSLEVYGTFYKNNRLYLNSSYGLEKIAVENIVSTKNTKNVIFRLGNVFGNDLNWSATVFNKILNDKIYLPFKGLRYSNIVSIETICRMILAIIENDITVNNKTIFNAINKKNLNWSEVYKLHANALNINLNLNLLNNKISKNIYNSLEKTLKKNTYIELIKQYIKSIKIINIQALQESSEFKRNFNLFLTKFNSSNLIKNIKSIKNKSTDTDYFFLKKEPWLFSNQIPFDNKFGKYIENVCFEKEVNEYGKNFLIPLGNV